jgi:hypothetical protein
MSFEGGGGGKWETSGFGATRGLRGVVGMSEAGGSLSVKSPCFECA